MNDFFEKHLGKMIGSMSFLSIIQFIGQMHDYLADGQFDTHEIEQMFLSCTSASQTVIVMALVIYMKYIKK